MFGLGLFGLLILIGTPIAAIIALNKANDGQRRLGDIERTLVALRKQIRNLQDELESLRSGSPESARPRETPAAPPHEAPSRAAAESLHARPQHTGPIREVISGGAAPPPPRQPPPPSGIASLEDALTSRWLVWLGAVAIALSGAFFVKYAIDHELLGPAARVSLGVLLGLVLAVGGEWLRQRPLQRAIAAIRPNYVPPALTSSGIFMMFVSFYAAYAVYGLLPPLIAFACLAATALLAVGLSLWQGPFVALLGLPGAFVSPALVATPHPSVWALFVYLWVVEIACLGVVRYRAWWWLAFAALTGVAVWPLLWMMGGQWHLGDAMPLGLYLISSAASFFLLPSGLEPSAPREKYLDELRVLALPEKVVWIAGSVVATVLVLLVNASNHSLTARILFGLAIVLYLAVGRREASVEGLAIVGAIATLAVVAMMAIPFRFAPQPPHMYTPLVPAELNAFAATCIAYGGMFAFGGFAFLWGARRPGLWAGVSAAVPVLLLAIAYWRIVDFEVSIQWAVGAVIMAAISLFAAERIERYRTVRGLDVSLGMYAAAVVALVSLAATMMLREAWLTVALSLQLPALALIRQRIPVRALDVIAATIAGAVLVRLLFNYNILGYALSRESILSWIFYGYGIPACAFFFAARRFRLAGTAVASLVTLLEAGALVFAVLFVSLQIRFFITGSLSELRYPFIEQALQSIAWLAIGGGLAAIDAREKNLVAAFGARLLLGLAAVQIVFLQLLYSNPLFTGETIAGPPLIDSLLLGYALPALFLLAIAATRKAPSDRLTHLASGAGFLLLFVYLSLEVRRAYHGAILTSPGFGNAEMYAYSIAWLVYAAVLFAAGMFLRQSTIRYAALTVLALTSLKVFLFDMSGLTGLYRATSFLGLGLSLVAIGYLYQRFVLRPPAPDAG